MSNPVPFPLNADTPPNVASASVDQSFFPSAKLALSIRFEEFGDLTVQASAPPKPLNVVRGTSATRTPLVVVPDNSVPNVRRFSIQQPDSTTPLPGSPQSATGSSDGYTRWVAGIIPKSATWNQNGVRAGDTLTCRIKFVDCPLDPRTIRSCAVEYFLGSVTADAYARGVAGQTRTPSSPQSNYAEPFNVVPDAFTDDQGRQRSNLRFEGWVDKWEIEFDDEDEPVITLECVDNTRLLIDIEAPPGLVIAANIEVDQAIANYLANFPTCEGLTVQYLPAGATPPRLDKALAGTAYRPNLGPVPARGGAPDTKLSVWDYLTDVCGALGHLIRIDGRFLVIQQPITLLSTSEIGRTDDPYQGRTVDGFARPFRLFMWGRNVRKLHIARNYSRREPTNIEVRCYSTRRKNDLVVRFPDPSALPKKRMVKARPGNAVVDQKWMVWRVRGVEDKETLLTIAQNVYMSVARMQFELDLETRNLASFGGSSQLDPDILDMKTGDTFDLQVAREPDGNYGTIEATDTALITYASQFMQKLGFAQDFADAYATAYTNQGFQTRFRLRTMAIEWDIEEGVTLSIHGVNYVEVRMDGTADS